MLFMGLPEANRRRLDFIESLSDAVSRSTYTLTPASVSSGNKILVVTIGSADRNDNNAEVPTGVTYNGTSMTKAVDGVGTSLSDVAGAIYYLETSDNTGNLVISFSDTQSGVGVFVYEVTANGAAAPTQAVFEGNLSPTTVSFSGKSGEVYVGIHIDNLVDPMSGPMVDDGTIQTADDGAEDRFVRGMHKNNAAPVFEQDIAGAAADYLYASWS